MRMKVSYLSIWAYLYASTTQYTIVPVTSSQSDSGSSYDEAIKVPYLLCRLGKVRLLLIARYLHQDKPIRLQDPWPGQTVVRLK
jgi:hypothetical protein